MDSTTIITTDQGDVAETLKASNPKLFSTVRHVKARPEALAISLRNYQSELSPDERLTLWEKLREGYCELCGTIMLPSKGCECQGFGIARAVEMGIMEDRKCHCYSAIDPCDPVELNPARMSEMIARQYDVSNGAPNRT